MIQQSTYIWKHATEVVQGISRNIVSSSLAVLLGSCTPLEILPKDQLNADMEPQMQNVPLPLQSVHDILSGKSHIIEEESLGGLLGGIDDSTKKGEEYVDDNGNIFTREELESGNQ